MFEDKQRKEGKPVSHAFAKEALASVAGAEVDKLFESKGLNALDKEKAKHHAKEHAKENYDRHYGDKEQWHPDHDAPIDYRR